MCTSAKLAPFESVSNKTASVQPYNSWEANCQRWKHGRVCLTSTFSGNKVVSLMLFEVISGPGTSSAMGVGNDRLRPILPDPGS